MEETKIVDRKFILDYLNNARDIWEMKGRNLVSYVLERLVNLENYLNNAETSNTNFTFSLRQINVLEQLNLPTSEIEKCFLDNLNNVPRNSRFIGDSYYNFWDYFYDYGKKKDKPIYQKEIDLILPILKRYIYVCKIILQIIK